MALKNPAPPTPPTPPAMDRGDGTNSHAKIDAPNFFNVPFVNDGGVNFKNPATETFQPSEGEENFSEDEVAEEENSKQTSQQNPAVGKKEVTTPETLARDAVANGAGALTKKTVTKPEQENSAATPKNQTQVTIPSDADRILNDSERGKAVLREFQEEDMKISGEEKNQTSTETPKNFQNNFTQPQQGGLYWIVILIFAIVGGFVFVKKFLITDKPKLKKSDLFDEADNRLKKVSEKISSSVEKKSPPPAKPTYSAPPKVTRPAKVQKKDDDDKGKHFEVRV